MTKKRRLEVWLHFLFARGLPVPLLSGEKSWFSKSKVHAFSQTQWWLHDEMVKGRIFLGNCSLRCFTWCGMTSTATLSADSSSLFLIYHTLRNHFFSLPFTSILNKILFIMYRYKSGSAMGFHLEIMFCFFSFWLAYLYLYFKQHLPHGGHSINTKPNEYMNVIEIYFFVLLSLKQH